ncbi:MAG: hypothetical protein WC717_01715 [Candidatus Micrarchaeia archaeon]
MVAKMPMHLADKFFLWENGRPNASHLSDEEKERASATDFAEGKTEEALLNEEKKRRRGERQLRCRDFVRSTKPEEAKRSFADEEI